MRDALGEMQSVLVLGGTSDIVLASDHGLYGMSGSFPLIRPPGSAALRLCPNSPNTIAQSPDRSAGP